MLKRTIGIFITLFSLTGTASAEIGVWQCVNYELTLNNGSFTLKHRSDVKEYSGIYQRDFKQNGMVYKLNFKNNEHSPGAFDGFKIVGDNDAALIQLKGNKEFNIAASCGPAISKVK